MLSILTSRLLVLAIVIGCSGGVIVAMGSRSVQDQDCMPLWKTGSTMTPIAFAQPEKAGPPAAVKEPAKPVFLVDVMSKYDFAETMDMLEGAMELHHVLVLDVVGTSDLLRAVDVEAGRMNQILFFHPRYFKRIRELNPSAVIEQPFMFSVIELPDSQVMIRYAKPTHKFGPYENLAEIGTELDKFMETLVLITTF
jgi:uncharacterized protein (DUF302 family)